MPSTARTLMLAALPAFALACSDADPFEPALHDTGPESTAQVGAGFPLYGIGGIAAATPLHPCDASAHREFDFWLGAWDVYNPDGDLIGTNSVTSELDGCVVAEHWTNAGGVRGRSINTFDRETGQWHQTWVSANFAGHLRMAGGLDETGRMVLEGQRHAVNLGVTLFDEYRWTPVSDDEVEQFGSLTVPAAGFESTFLGIYERRDAISPAPEAPTTGCQAGGPAEQARQLDFWIGDWVVSTAAGKVLGTSTVSTDLSGCLLEERFRTPGGYEAVAFAAFDFYEQEWFRTYIDNRAEQLRWTGAFEAATGTMTFTGNEAGPGSSGEVLQQATIAPDGSGAVRQTLRVSRDGGTSWSAAVVLVYKPTS